MTDGTIGRRAAMALALPALLAAPRLARAAAPARLGEDVLGEIRALAQEFVRAYGVPGLSVALAKDGRLAYAGAYGFADTARKEAMTPDHLLRIASVSKPVTSTALHVLMQQGRVFPHSRVFGPDGVLGTAYGRPPYPAHVADVTVGHLLEHTAGGWGNAVNDPMFSRPGYPLASLIADCVASARLVQPGSAYAYSNLGYAILGRVIEKVSGKPYAAYVQEAVLGPAGVKGMRIGGSTLADRAPGEAVYYGVGENPYSMDVPRMDAHGGWIASPKQLVRFAAHALGDRKPALLRPAIVTAMTIASAANPGYARGWGLYSGSRTHNGSLPGTLSVLTRTLNGECFAAVCNTRRPGDDMVRALEYLPWAMAARIPWWPSEDLDP